MNLGYIGPLIIVVSTSSLKLREFYFHSHKVDFLLLLSCSYQEAIVKSQIIISIFVRQFQVFTKGLRRNDVL